MDTETKPVKRQLPKRLFAARQKLEAAMRKDSLVGGQLIGAMRYCLSEQNLMPRLMEYGVDPPQVIRCRFVLSYVPKTAEHEEEEVIVAFPLTDFENFQHALEWVWRSYLHSLFFIPLDKPKPKVPAKIGVQPPRSEQDILNALH